MSASRSLLEALAAQALGVHDRATRAAKACETVDVPPKWHARLAKAAELHARALAELEAAYVYVSGAEAREFVRRSKAASGR